MKKRYLIFLLLGALASCDKKNDNTPNVNSYPMTVGTQWTYYRQTISKKYESETSDKVVSIDTTESEYKVWIDKDTIINNKTYKVFKTQQNESSNISKELKFIDSLGLKSIYNPSINYELIPNLEIQLPLTMNSKWTFVQAKTSGEFQIDKEVIGNETVHILNQNFNCYKVSSNNSLFKGPIYIEWISEKGMIKSFYNSGLITYTNQDGEPMDYGQTIETTTLKQLIIK